VVKKSFFAYLELVVVKKSKLYHGLNANEKKICSSYVAPGNK
jgi:hypothetical protein